ncbi:Glycosyl transferase, group 2 family protein [Flavobacterium psychrophilum]|uniref:glycosyltransferase family 2 protein n=1 Tax=Flavobacterium psychrophilum TaxID=96345 RepID=UPI000B7C1FE7|nr:glycosyltransferase family 2 protein [Flavobacterium psychrophilum]SNB11619.1 Glycosyl transferase, group 2 family protein [Flavobacterium psychrophilum]SNB13149.1 Glycosyl transferase, group 2 family protein [Flavobacterium psychrophilum]
MPFFSIIIPLYNKENYIEYTLKSVLNQSFIDFEIIIVNDGSTDNSEQIVFQFNDKRIHYFHKKNEGVSIARNFGIEQAKSDFICFLDADDFWYENYLEIMQTYIEKFSTYKVFSSAIEIETSKTIFPAQYSIKKNADFEIINFFEASEKECAIWTSSSVFHKSIFKKTGVFDPNIKISEDTDLWIRIGLQYPIVFIWKTIARYVYDEQSVSRTSNYIFEESSFLKYVEKEKTNKELKKYLDLNRFSAAIKNKLNDNYASFEKVIKEINLTNLSFKKRLLLKLPTPILKKIILLKLFLANLGIGNSIFK